MMKESLGDYALVRKLGQGALGAVFLAEHRFFKRPFALKVLPEELAQDAAFVRRFEKEALALASLEHPHIVKIHNMTQADGKYFLVTECVVGEEGVAQNLAEFLQKNALSEEEIFSIAYQMASALDFAHKREVDGVHLAHGSVKPNNVLVRKTADGVQAYLCDFGLARVVGAARVLGRTYKAVADVLAVHEMISALHRTFVQNFIFLAPEQKRELHQCAMGAEAEDAQGASDVCADLYAFGVLIYYLLTRQFPEGFFEMPSRLVPTLKYAWDPLIAECLQVNPQKRPASLVVALEKLLPSLAPMDKTPKPLLKPAEVMRPEFEPDPAAIFQIETAIGHYKPEKVEEKKIEPIPSAMAIIPAGSYRRGSQHGARDEIPSHQVCLAAFAIDVHPVTNEQFARFLEVMGGEKDVNNNDIIRLRESRIKRSGGKLNIESGYARHPVVGVTWYGAVAYAKWVGKRLPTEAEWEVAAKGGVEEAIYPTGERLERTEANFFSSDTTAVMSYPPNAYGLYDMAGNVYEWCQDWYDYHYYNASVQEPNNPKGPVQGVYRVLRGGCWKSLKEDMRCAHRHRNNPGAVNGTYGFRCAADVQV